MIVPLAVFLALRLALEDDVGVDVDIQADRLGRPGGDRDRRSAENESRYKGSYGENLAQRGYPYLGPDLMRCNMNPR
jgi:hypothetical protein